MSRDEIVVQGAREHNLKGFDLRIPRGALTTITGVSGSGKSSLAFDTIFQEGQRRFVESLSAYARQFLGNLDKPRVDRIDGLSPTVSIDQKTTNRNPRSTVGTITEIHDHLRLLFARLGEASCPECGKGLAALTKDQIAERILQRGGNQPASVLAPLVRGRKGEYRKELSQLRLKGWTRARIDGEVKRLDEPISLARNKKHTIELVVDRFSLTAENATRLAEAVGQALNLGSGTCAVLIGEQYQEYASALACQECGVSLPEIEPRLFSFNSPYGACPECEGLGLKRAIDPALVVRDAALSIREGAIGTIGSNGVLPYSNLGVESLEQVAAHYGFSLDQPWKSPPSPSRR
jgi:excinuclease ABC subunit A